MIHPFVMLAIAAMSFAAGLPLGAFIYANFRQFVHRVYVICPVCENWEDGCPHCNYRGFFERWRWGK